MDALDALSARARRLGGLAATESAGNGSSESETENDDEVAQAYRLLQLVKLLLVIIATALTIGRMLGWL